MGNIVNTHYGKYSLCMVNARCMSTQIILYPTKFLHKISNKINVTTIIDASGDVYQRIEILESNILHIDFKQ